MNKVYVDVVAEFRKDGQLVPIFFTWEDGRKYSIDRILKIERCASRKAGGVGTVSYTHLRNADQIFVLSGGHIVQTGKHEDLIRQPGIYADFIGIRKKAIGWKLR